MKSQTQFGGESLNVKIVRSFLEGFDLTSKAEKIYSYKGDYMGIDLLEMFLEEMRKEPQVFLDAVQVSLTNKISKTKNGEAGDNKRAIPQNIDELSYKFTRNWLKRAKRKGLNFESLLENLSRPLGSCNEDLVKSCKEIYPDFTWEKPSREIRFVPTSYLTPAGYRSDAVDLATIPKIPSGILRNAGWEVRQLLNNNVQIKNSL